MLATTAPVNDVEVQIEVQIEATLDELSVRELRELAAATLRLRAQLSRARQNFKHKPESKEAISKSMKAAWVRRREADAAQRDGLVTS